MAVVCIEDSYNLAMIHETMFMYNHKLKEICTAGITQTVSPTTGAAVASPIGEFSPKGANPAEGLDAVSPPVAILQICHNCAPEQKF